MKPRRLIPITAFLLLASLLAPGLVRAENKPLSFSVSPMFGGIVYDKKANLKHMPYAQLGLGLNLTRRISLEGAIYYSLTDDKTTDADVNVYGGRLDGVYHLMPDKKLMPYVALGVGNMVYNPVNAKYENKFMADWALGVKYFVTDSIALRAEVRDVISFDPFRGNVAYSLGLTFNFGGKEMAAAMPMAEPVVMKDEPRPMAKDTDGDGVGDDKDECPGTPAGVAVDANGCPRDADGDGVADYIDRCANTPRDVAVDVFGCPKDMDGDGVPDYQDRCPGTKWGIAVDEMGCPKDTDGDGVPDSLDKCPGTPPEIKVDADGCPIPLLEAVTIRLDIKFLFNSFILLPAYDGQVERVANFMKAYPNTTVDIEGHTDSKGPQKYNEWLSQKRAETVRDRLISQFGVSAERLKAIGYGESRPIASNDTEAGRAQNRRVVAVITAVKTVYETK